MASGALKIARERLVANVKDDKFGPRVIFLRFAPHDFLAIFFPAANVFEKH